MADEIKATPRQRPVIGKLSDLIGYADQFVRKPFGYDNPPAALLSDFLSVPQIQRTLDRVSYGEPLTTGRGLTTQMRPDTVDAAMAVAPAVARWPKQAIGLASLVAPYASSAEGSALAAAAAAGRQIGPAQKALKEFEAAAKKIHGKDFYWKIPDSDLIKYESLVDAAKAEKASAKSIALPRVDVDPLDIQPVNMRKKFVQPDLFHGSADRIERFDTSLLGSNTKAKDAEIGIHFAGSHSDAGFYADLAARNFGGPGYVGKYKTSASKPLVISEDGNVPAKLLQKMIDDKMFARKYADKYGFDSIVYPQGTNVDSAYTQIVFSPDHVYEVK